MIICEPFKVSKILSHVLSYVLFQFFGDTFRAEKLSNSQIFGNFFERWRKCENIRISKKCQIEIFGATKNFSAQLKMITIFFENDDQGSRDGRPRTTSHYRTKPSKNFPYDFNTV